MTREIGVHLAAKVFEEAVREKSSMVALRSDFSIIILLLLLFILFNIFIVTIHRHLHSVQHMNKEMYEHFQYGGLEELKSYIRSNT